MIVSIIVLAILCLFLLSKLFFPLWFTWEDKLAISTGLVVVVWAICCVWLGFCAAIHWTIQNIIT